MFRLVYFMYVSQYISSLFQAEVMEKSKRVQNSIISKGSNMLFFITGDRRMLNGSSAVASKQRTRSHLSYLFKPVFFRRLLSGKKPVIIMTLSMKVFGVFFKVLLMMLGRFYRSASRCRDI